jgi:hypothetical protein
VLRYLEEVENVEFGVDPLEWWRRRGVGYPYLAPLARKWLACVATSVPSEREFSSAGNTVTAKRSSLTLSIVRDLLYIHDNFEFSELDSSFTKSVNDP